MSAAARIVLDHVTLTVTDLARSAHFFDAALGPLGVSRAAEFLDPEDEDEVGVEAISYAGPDARPVLWLVVGRTPTTGVHLAFTAPDDAAVRAAFTAATAAGGIARRAPRGWEIYRPGGFGAMIESPDGALVEVFMSTTDVTPVTLTP